MATRLGQQNLMVHSVFTTHDQATHGKFGLSSLIAQSAGALYRISPAPCSGVCLGTLVE